ncbi:MAG: hypothetical protein M5T61_14995 [Acidimicrobiia bacterium]|nr:hypothetical protein [Acidimicrobiia bacterium]
MRHRTKLAAAGLSLLLFAAAGCGGDDDSDAADETVATTAADDSDAADGGDTTEPSDDTSDDTTDDATGDTADDDAGDTGDALSEDEIRTLCESYASVGVDVCVDAGGPSNVPFDITVGDVRAELVLFVDDAYRTGLLTIDNQGAEPVCDAEVTAIEETNGAEMFALVEPADDPSSTCAPPNFSYNVTFPSDLVLSPGDFFSLHLDGAEVGGFTEIG